MKIVLAFDSFKGCLPADAACRIAARALAECRPDATIVEKPLADGGEGTAAVLLSGCGGEWIPVPATGPLPTMTVDAGYALLADGRTAVVETAAASGLTLLRHNQLNPLLTTTVGTGELLHAALGSGADTILLAAGGSATVDGGIGMAHALGWRFYDEDGEELPPNGAALIRITAIRRPESFELHRGHIIVLCDVRNPLCGLQGAARVYGPQKGASPEMVEQLDAGLAHLAQRVRDSMNIDLINLVGGGAAGGLAAGAFAFLQAHLESGIDVVMRKIGFEEALQGADWVLTGEGMFDAQSLHGKVVSGVAGAASHCGVKMAVLAGSVALNPSEWRAAGINYVDAITPAGLSLDDAIRAAPDHLHRAVVRFAQECL